MKLLLRAATEEDSDRVSEIYLAARKTFLAYAPLAHSDREIHEWVKERLIPSGGVIVAEQDRELVGMMAVSRDQHHGWIDHLYLHPRQVGNSIGSAFVVHAKSLLKAPVRLYTFQANEAARRFYQRHGFKEILFSDGATNEERTPDVLLEWSE